MPIRDARPQKHARTVRAFGKQRLYQRRFFTWNLGTSGYAGLRIRTTNSCTLLTRNTAG